jgi:hypothetical protein
MLVPGAYLTIRVLATPPLPQAPGVVIIYPLEGSTNLATIHRVAEKMFSRQLNGFLFSETARLPVLDSLLSPGAG